MILYRQSVEKSLTLQKIACLYHDLGVNVIPIIPDGSKSPDLASWKRWQSQPVTHRRIKRWWCFPYAIAILAGKVSGNLEILDFDDGEIFKLWWENMLATDAELLNRLVMVETPKDGRHLYYRCEEIERNQKLAVDEDGKAFIETRGEGGYVLAPGSPSHAHKLNRPYRLIQGSFNNIPLISPAERRTLFDEAGRFTLKEIEEGGCCSKVLMDEREKFRQIFGDEALPYFPKRPGDDFNERATWREILEPHGWELVSSYNGRCLWRRPGKNEGNSATTNYHNNGLLVVFSTSTVFQSGKGYTKFAAYATLNHGGNYKAAAKELSRKGFGD